MILVGMEPEYAILAGVWRRECPEALRTAEVPSKQSQMHWFESLEHSNHRYWGCVEGEKVIGIAGLTYISLDNRSAEISLIIDPQLRGKGFGREAVNLILKMAFDRMNLDIVYGEVYNCAEGGVFWHKVLDNYPAKWVNLPDRKWWNGVYWDSEYFSIRRKT